MEKDIEKLKELEKSFIINSDAELEDYTELIRRSSRYAKVDNYGYVILGEKTSNKFTIKESIVLVLITRYLANKLQEKLKKDITIQEEVSADEIARISNSKKSVVMARAKELKDSRKIFSGKKKGTYKIAPHYIKTFLDLKSSNNNL